MTSIDEIVAQAAQAGLFRSRPLKGCTQSEIEFLEHRYQFALPSDYRRFLELAGHQCGILFRWDHLAVSYEYVLEMTGDQRARLREDHAPSLPADALIISGRLSEQFQLIRTEQGDASAVWHYAEWAPSPKIMYRSVPDWLAANLQGAIEAQASGYFARYPQGTEP